MYNKYKIHDLKKELVMLKNVLAALAVCVGFISPATAQNCPEDSGAVYGTAEFTGDPWVYSWVIDIEWDNDSGDWVEIDPIVHTLDVPGESLTFSFDDGTTFVYGADLAPGHKADNLWTIQHRQDGMSVPYQAMRTSAGEVFLLHEEERTCGVPRWNLAH
jgi:hypothetical protein